MKFSQMVKTEIEVTHLLADMGPRYWEDGKVNGETDNEDSPTMPLVKDNRWQILIDLETGKIRDWPEGTTASVHYKVCDDGVYTLLSASGEAVARLDGYVPRMLCPEENGYGDYVIMDIGADGVIAGWKADLSYFEEGDDE